MAQKRMFSKKITHTDAFVNMPMSVRLLYYELNMEADDDGFVDSPSRIMRMIGCVQDDINILIDKKFVIPFETGVCVIKHWLIHNTIRRDRYTPTNYIDEKAKLSLKKNNIYTLGNQMATNGRHRLEEISIVESSIEEISVVEDREEKNNIKDVIDYLNEKIDREFRYTTGATIKIVNARYNEGFVYKDFITVIDNAYKHWCNNGNEFANMKPSILFNGSFESRLDNSTYDWVDNNKPSKEKTAEELFNE